MVSLFCPEPCCMCDSGGGIQPAEDVKSSSPEVGSYLLLHSRHELPARTPHNQQHKSSHLTHIILLCLLVKVWFWKETPLGSMLKKDFPTKYSIWGKKKKKVHSSLDEPQKRTHPLVECLKWAIDSSERNQIKTSHRHTAREREREEGGKKHLLHKAMSRGLPHESRSCPKSNRKYWQSLWGEKK